MDWCTTRIATLRLGARVILQGPAECGIITCESVRLDSVAHIAIASSRVSVGQDYADVLRDGHLGGAPMSAWLPANKRCSRLFHLVIDLDSQLVTLGWRPWDSPFHYCCDHP